MDCETIDNPCPFTDDKRPECLRCPVRIAWSRLGLDDKEHPVQFLPKDKYPVLIPWWRPIYKEDYR